MMSISRSGRRRRNFGIHGTLLFMVTALFPLAARADNAPKYVRLRYNNQKLYAYVKATAGKQYTYTLTHDPNAVVTTPPPLTGTVMGFSITSWDIAPATGTPVGAKHTFSVTVANTTTGNSKKDSITLPVVAANAATVVVQYSDPSPPAEIDLDRPLSESDADPGSSITDPTGAWHELWPKFCSNWSSPQWKDNGDGILSICDYIFLKREASSIQGWYHVEDVTITLTLTEKPALTATSHFDYFGPDAPADITVALTNPVGTTYYEVFPNHASLSNVTGWTDEGDGRLGAGDQIELTNKDSGTITNYRVDAVTTDIEVKTPIDVPAASSWGLLALTVLMLAAGTLVLRRRVAV